LKHWFIFHFIIYSGTNKDTRGTAYVVYDDIFDAKKACEHLSGYNLLGRYLIVLYYQPDKVAKKRELERQQKEIEEIKAKMAFDPNVNQ
jgi:pre-mRNA branch site protein p14